jgi:apolipoprotein N-acyltransferase
VAVGPRGDILATYFKTKLPPGETSVPGDGRIGLVDTPYGRIALAICYDLDSPDFVRQAGLAGADLLIAPSSDGRAIETRHADSARLRAVENGVTLVRPTLRGLTVIADPYGRPLLEQDWFAGQTTLQAQVPVASVWTVYPRIGDLLAYLSASGLVIVSLVGVLRAVRRRAANQSTLRAAPIQ